MLKPVLYFAVAAAAAALLLPDMVERALAPAAASVRPASANFAEPEASADITRVPADRNGHYVTEVQINGRGLTAIVDTGASLVTLRYQDARALGVVFPGDKFDIRVQTANGPGRARQVRLRSVRLGSITLSDVDALVVDEGALATNLLGMSFLKRLSRYEVRGSTLVLER
jgi:aspartyl protease family protein